MFDLIIYIIPTILLVIGVLLYFVGSSKDNNKLKGIGIGFIISLIALELPNFVQGFIEGYTSS
jgi:Na+/phosphate symporter